jgi:hypothetical protein
MPAGAGKVNTPATATQRSYRHFSWVYQYDAQNPRRDWYEQPDGSWWEVYPNGTHSHLRLVNASSGFNNASGHLVEKDDNSILVFVPEKLATGESLVFWKSDTDLTKAPFLLGQMTVYKSTAKAWNAALGQAVQDLDVAGLPQQERGAISTARVANAASQQDSAKYTGSARCSSEAPSPLQLAFNCNLVSHGSGPADVVFSMRNGSGCRVAMKGIGQVTGTLGHVYVTNPPGASQSLGSRSNGFSFDDERTPFGAVLAPNGQEYPASCEIDHIVVCSATAPENFPTATYFRPFVDGKCITLAHFGPVTFNQNSCGTPQTSLDWVNSIHRTSDETLTVSDVGSGILVHRFIAAHVTNMGNDDTTIPYAALGSVSVSVSPGAARLSQNDLWLLAMRPNSTATFQEHQDAGYNNGDYDVHGMELYFDSAAGAQAARDFLEYHRCLGR